MIDWSKRGPFSWRLDNTPDHMAVIDKVSGNGGFPYMWTVYPMPRPQGRWNAIGKGSCKTLAEAKTKAAAITEQAENKA